MFGELLFSVPNFYLYVSLPHIPEIKAVSFVFLLLDPFPGKQKYLDRKTDPSDSTTTDYELEDIITIIMVG